MADYLFETLPGEPVGPQALIARQAADWVLPVHFHMQHQVQVVLRGSGTLGRHVLAPGSVHYTSPQSAYGPIAAGNAGLDYFTLRVLTDKGAWYLPEARAFMQPKMHKEQHWGTAEVGSTGCTTLISLREDGLGVWSYRLSAEESVECSHPISEAGRFHMVLGGSFRLADRSLPRESCVYTTPGEQLRFTALEADATLIVVQFPRQAAYQEVAPELRIAPSSRGTSILDDNRTA